MSAPRFYNAIPSSYHGNDRIIVAYFVYYLVEEQGKPAATAAQLKQCFIDCDISPPSRIAQYLSEGITSKPPHFVKAAGIGYRLERARKEAIASSLGARTAIVQTSAELRALESLFPDGSTKTYLSEAIDCFEAGANRGAVIMAWVLTMDHFLNYVFANKLTEFNRALPASSRHSALRLLHRVLPSSPSFHGQRRWKERVDPPELPCPREDFTNGEIRLM